MGLQSILLFLQLLVILNFKNIAADVSQGYRLNAGYGSAGSAFLHSPPSSYLPGRSSGGGHYFGNYYTGGGSSSYRPTYSGSASLSPFIHGGSGVSSGSIAHGISSGSQIGLGQNGGGAVDHSPLLSKHFYVFSGPVDHDEQELVRHINIGRPRTNYRVVFINAPSSSASKAKIIANVAPVEEKTAIYVLTKKNHDLNINAEVNTPNAPDSKPEVFFIKYKNDAEAIHAQDAIQAQFDTLGGSSVTTNEGVAPASSVIGSLGDIDGDSGFDGINGGGAFLNPTYLPQRRHK